jgi:glycosyltransferase involved in cell wall biosynthesis
VVSVLTHALSASGADEWEVVLVTTLASRDGTLELAAKLASEEPRVRVVEQPVSDPGYGRAVALGIRQARLQWLLLSDADGQFEHSELGRFVERTGSADVILGYRAERRDSLARRVAGRIYTSTIQQAAGIAAVRDVDCAFKLIRSALLAGPPFRSRTGAVNAEIIGRALLAGGRLEQLPVMHRRRLAGTARFETRVGALPQPREVLSILYEVVALAGRRFVQSSTRRQ